MATLRFHHTLYSKVALEEAIQVFGEFGELKLEQDMPYYQVELSAAEADDEAELVGEFQNYALALTIEEKRAGE